MSLLPWNCGQTKIASTSPPQAAFLPRPWPHGEWCWELPEGAGQPDGRHSSGGDHTLSGL